VVQRANVCAAGVQHSSAQHFAAFATLAVQVRRYSIVKLRPGIEVVCGSITDDAGESCLFVYVTSRDGLDPNSTTDMSFSNITVYTRNSRWSNRIEIVAKAEDSLI
jgi:hypothetical protein